jgi:hypothetical protein
MMNAPTLPISWRGALALALATLALGAACGPEFDPYFRVEALRVMGVRASKPWMKPGEVATMDALVFSPGDGEVTYAWSWCPFSAGSSDAYECAVSYEELQGQVEGLGVQILPFELGNTPSIDFPYPVPPEFIRATCAALAGQEVPDFVQLPDCEKGFDVNVKLVVRAGEQEITSVKSVRLVIEPDGESNQNPVLMGAAVKPMGAAVASATPLTPQPPVKLARDEDFDILALFEVSSSEAFVDADTGESRNESLIVSWFVQGGELDPRRNGYLPPNDTIEASNSTTWRTPIMADFPEDTTEVFILLRDGRGGIDWKSYPVEFE